MKNIPIIKIVILALLIIVLSLFFYSYSKIEMVCVPTGKHLNKDKYIILKEEIISNKPFSISRIYYIAKNHDKKNYSSIP
jgi:hypothetical protein